MKNNQLMLIGAAGLGFFAWQRGWLKGLIPAGGVVTLPTPGNPPAAPLRPTQGVVYRTRNGGAYLFDGGKFRWIGSVENAERVGGMPWANMPIIEDTVFNQYPQGERAG